MRIPVRKSSVLVPGFRFAGVACGIKFNGKKDLSLIVSDVPATAAAAFTKNALKAAPVLLGKERLRAGRLQALLINSGNANAATGQPGLRVAQDSCALVARLLGIPEQLVLPSSTGKIGVLLPWPKMANGIRAACRVLSPRGFWNAAHGIMTTDAFPKTSVRRIVIDGRQIIVAGMAKGAGMIHPNMATMLCYVLTDARVERVALRQVLKSALAKSFNAISVDGDTSTNDTVVVLANGVARNNEVRRSGKDYAAFAMAVTEVMRDLCRMIVKDGEGATRIVDIFVRGARSTTDAQRIARTVACSPLVKTAFFGGDPNWGRLACAVGYAGAALDPQRLDIRVGDVLIGRNGESTGITYERQAAVVMSQPEFAVTIDLHLGTGAAHMVTSDLSPAYVRFNSAYST